MLNDRQGIPLALGLSAANYADSLTLAPMLDTVQPIKRPLGRPRKRPSPRAVPQPRVRTSFPSNTPASSGPTTIHSEKF